MDIYIYYISIFGVIVDTMEMIKTGLPTKFYKNGGIFESSALYGPPYIIYNSKFIARN